MRIGIVSPTFPPARCGVADHSWHLLQQLASMGHQCVHFSNLLEVNSYAEELDTVILQYTPELWSKNKLRLNFSIVRECRRLKRRMKVVMIAHELHYPVQLNARGLIYGIGQKLQFLALHKTLDWTFFSYRAAQKISRIPSSVLPISSSIAVIPDESISEEPPLLRLVHFGGAHPTHLLHWTALATLELKNLYPKKNIELHWVGITENQKQKILTGLKNKIEALDFELLNTLIIAHGYVSESEVSSILRSATVVLAPFLDGISTRRSSVMAAFKHGCAVLTTIGWATDNTFKWEKFCALSKNSLPEFTHRLIELLNDHSNLEAMGQKAQKEYEKSFSWPVVAAQLIRELEDLR